MAIHHNAKSLMIKQIGKGHNSEKFQNPVSLHKTMDPDLSSANVSNEI